MANTRIYLIEDDPFIIDLVTTTLQQRPDLELIGHASTLKEALDEAPRSGADVFLVDLGLPDGHGEAVLERIAQAYPHSHRMVFSVFDNPTRFAQAVKAGATGYVLKGCTPDELLFSLDRLIAGDAPMPPLLAKMLLLHFRHEPPSQALPLDAAAAAGAGSESEDQVKVGPDGHVALSAREVDVLKLAKLGWSNKEIARELQIAESTVQTHFKKIFRKLAVNNRLQALNAAGASGWS